MSKGKNKGIYKRGNVYWICYSSLDGRIIRESSKSRKFKDAEDLLIQRRQSVRDGKLPEIKKIKNYTFRELSVDYIKWCERQRGFEQKKNVIRQLVSEFGNYTLRSFNTKILEQYQTEKLKKIKPSTINRHVSTIKHMFTKSVDWEMVEEDVLKRIRKVKKLDENNKRLRYLTKEQCQLLVDSCDIHLRPIVVTGLNTGMRKSEILNLRWDQVDLRNNIILLEQTKNGERRQIPVNETLKDTLRSLVRRLDVPYVFYNPDTRKPYRNVRRSFDSVCKRVGIKDFHFHDLRHTFSSLLVMEGLDINTLRELLGHKSLQMTLRYSHLSPSHREKSVKILDDLFSGKPTSQLLHKK